MDLSQRALQTNGKLFPNFKFLAGAEKKLYIFLNYSGVGLSNRGGEGICADQLAF